MGIGKERDEAQKFCYTHLVYSKTIYKLADTSVFMAIWEQQGLKCMLHAQHLWESMRFTSSSHLCNAAR